MRSTVLFCGMLSLIFGQMPSLAWVELADTVYEIKNAQDTFALYIQRRSGNVRRFERYDTAGGSFSLTRYDSVYLDGSGQVQRARSYYLLTPSMPILVMDKQFSYPGSPTLKVEVTDGTSPTVLVDLHCYGLTMFEGSMAFQIMTVSQVIPEDAYPTGYHIGQLGDSVVLRNFVGNNGAFVLVRRPRPGACDTAITYEGTSSNPTASISSTGKLCHTAGRIDSSVSTNSMTYWSYDANNRLIQRVRVGTSGSDTIQYTYDAAGRLIETRLFGVSNSVPYQRRYLLRYGMGSTSLSSALGGDCLFWDASQRRGALTCKSAGAYTALRLYDLQGRIVWQGSVRGAETFEVPPTLPPGLYYLHTDAGTARLYLMP